MGKLITINADKPISAYLAIPADSPRGAIIVIHEVWGLVDQIKSVADRFAKEGFVALAPSLLENSKFNSVEIAELQKAIFDPVKRNEVQPQLRSLMAPMQEPGFAQLTTDRVKTCFDFLYERPDVRQKVGIVGFCFGGAYSFSLAISEPKLTIAIPFYGPSDQPAKELANIKCPVRAFYGANDERLVSQLPDLKDRMKQAGVDFIAEVYPDCGHAFFNDSNPLAYNKKAADQAWAKVQFELSKNMP